MKQGGVKVCNTRLLKLDHSTAKLFAISNTFPNSFHKFVFKAVVALLHRMHVFIYTSCPKNDGIFAALAGNWFIEVIDIARVKCLRKKKSEQKVKY